MSPGKAAGSPGDTAACAFIFQLYLYCRFLLPCWARRNAPPAPSHPLSTAAAGSGACYRAGGRPGSFMGL